MDITEVRIKLMENTDDRLRAFCSITFDQSFVVRDLKIIDGTSGPFVAMPSRKLTSHCPRCGCKNYLKAAYCNQCGDRLREDRTVRDSEGRTKLYADIAHPINSACRESIQARVIAEFQAELQRAKQPGYASRYDDDYGYEDVELMAPSAAISRTVVAPAPPVEAPPPAPETDREAVVPPPHVRPGAVRAEEDLEDRPEASGGPHFTPRPVEEPPTPNDPSGKQAKGDFGAGILE